MAKEITCNVLKLHCTVDESEYGDTRLCEVSWNNRPCTGVDIRKYDKARESLFKGITISYQGFTEIVKTAIENSLVDTEVIEEALAKRKKKVFSDDDFTALFNKMNHEKSTYQRDQYGHLRDEDGRFVISARRKGLK